MQEALKFLKKVQQKCLSSLIKTIIIYNLIAIYVDPILCEPDICHSV